MQTSSSTYTHGLTCAVQQQQHGGRSSTSNNAAQPRPSTSAGNNVARTSTGNAGNGAPRAHATNGNWRQHNQSAGTVTGAPVVAGVKRSAEALNVYVPLLDLLLVFRR